MSRALTFLALGLAAASGFAAVARAVKRRDTAPVDRDVHEKTKVEDGHPVRRAAEAVAPIGKWWTYVPAAALAGGYVLVAKNRVAGTAAIVGAACAAAALNEVFDDVLPQPPAPPGRPRPDWPVFPSGHAFGTSAVALTAAYVLSREKVARASIVFPIAIAIPAMSSFARLAEEKHWISDIAGGHLAAITLASLTLAAYERFPRLATGTCSATSHERRSEMSDPNNAATDPRAAAQQDQVKADHDALQEQARRIDESVPSSGRAATDRDAAAAQEQVRADHDRMQESARRVEASVPPDVRDTPIQAANLGNARDDDNVRNADSARENADAARESARRVDQSVSDRDRR